MTGLQAAPREGDVLDGRFRIDGLIGHGGFGAVYQGTVSAQILRPGFRRRAGKTALVALLIADDDRVADALVASASKQEDVAAMRDGTGALT